MVADSTQAARLDAGGLVAVLGDLSVVDHDVCHAEADHNGVTAVLATGEATTAVVIAVELCDGIQSTAARAQINVVAIPASGPLTTPGMNDVLMQCNAAAEVTALLRGFTRRPHP